MQAVIEDGGIPIPKSDEHFQEFFKNERFMHYVGMISPPRLGVEEFVSLVEHRHFKPGTLRNELFIMRIIDLEDITWLIMSIPVEDISLAESAAGECGLRIANGVPTMISGNGFQRFPADNERVFTLENRSDHPTYRNDSVSERVILNAEQETVDRMKTKNRRSRYHA